MGEISSETDGRTDGERSTKIGDMHQGKEGTGNEDGEAVSVLIVMTSAGPKELLPSKEEDSEEGNGVGNEAMNN